MYPSGVTEKSGTGETGTVCYQQTDHKSGGSSGELALTSSLSIPLKSNTTALQRFLFVLVHKLFGFGFNGHNSMAFSLFIYLGLVPCSI